MLNLWNVIRRRRWSRKRARLYLPPSGTCEFEKLTRLSEVHLTTLDTQRFDLRHRTRCYALLALLFLSVHPGTVWSSPSDDVAYIRTVLDRSETLQGEALDSIEDAERDAGNEVYDEAVANYKEALALLRTRRSLLLAARNQTDDEGARILLLQEMTDNKSICKETWQAINFIRILTRHR